jgi:hypothetical protein
MGARDSPTAVAVTAPVASRQLLAYTSARRLAERLRAMISKSGREVTMLVVTRKPGESIVIGSLTRVRSAPWNSWLLSNESLPSAA